MSSAAAAPRRRTFRRFSYRGVDLEALLELPREDLIALMNARQRRRFRKHGIERKPRALLKRLRKAKKDVAGEHGVKPRGVKTHLRNMIIVPEMIGSIVGIYNGKSFNGVEIRPEMVGRYLGEFSITYRPVRHGRAGVAAANAHRYIPL